jgi:hypothetical protein
LHRPSHVAFHAVIGKRDLSAYRLCDILRAGRKIYVLPVLPQ